MRFSRLKKMYVFMAVLILQSFSVFCGNYNTTVNISVKASGCIKRRGGSGNAFIKINGENKITNDKKGIYIVVLDDNTGDVLNNFKISSENEINSFNREYGSYEDGKIIVMVTYKNCKFEPQHFPKEIEILLNNKEISKENTFYGVFCKGGVCYDKQLPNISRKNKWKLVGTTINLKLRPVATEVKPENYISTVESHRVMLPCGTYPVETRRDKVSWERKGRSVGKTDNDRFTVYPLNGSLTINSVSRDDEGWYTCIIFSRDEYSGVSRKIQMFLSVMYAPVIYNILEKQYAFVKKSTVLPCSSTGNPGVTYRWLLPNGQQIRKNEKYQISNNGSLIVKNVEIDDEKNYTCAPFNAIADGKSKQTQLIVLLAPKFLNPAKSEIVVDKQGNITLDCSSSGFPKPNVTWQHNGVGLKDISRVVFHKTGFLKLTNAVGDDTGTYTCSVKSIAGKLSRSIELVVRGKPGTPSNPKVWLSDEIAYVKWTRSYNGGSTQTFEIWVRDSSKDDYTGWKIESDIKSKEDNKNSNDEDEEHYFYLNKLIKPTRRKTYFFSVRALNGQGFSGFSKVVKLVKFGTETNTVRGSLIRQYLDARPFPPFDVFLNITQDGYVLQWKIKEVPGRPLAAKISIQYRENKSDGPWKELRQVDVGGAPSRMRSSLGRWGGSSGVIIQQNELGSNKLQEFLVVSVATDGTQSISQEPKATFIFFTYL